MKPGKFFLLDRTVPPFKIPMTTSRITDILQQGKVVPLTGIGILMAVIVGQDTPCKVLRWNYQSMQRVCTRLMIHSSQIEQKF